MNGVTRCGNDSCQIAFSHTSDDFEDVETTTNVPLFSFNTSPHNIQMSEVKCYLLNHSTSPCVFTFYTEMLRDLTLIAKESNALMTGLDNVKSDNVSLNWSTRLGVNVIWVNGLCLHSHLFVSGRRSKLNFYVWIRTPTEHRQSV